MAVVSPIILNRTVVEFLYDPRNRCVKRTINGTPTFFFYDEWNLVEERNSADASIALYVHGPIIDEILTKVSATHTIYYHHEVIGSVSVLTDNAGVVIEKYIYDVFGAPSITDAIGNIITSSNYGNRFMFTGREFIPEIGLFDFRNRMYTPHLGRFLQTDPIALNSGDYNLFRYTGNNPVNKIDPLGLVYIGLGGSGRAIQEADPNFIELGPNGRRKQLCNRNFIEIGTTGRAKQTSNSNFIELGSAGRLKQTNNPNFIELGPTGRDKQLKNPNYIPIGAPSRDGLTSPSGLTNTGMKNLANALAELTKEQAQIVADFFNRIAGKSGNRNEPRYDFRR